LWEGMKSPVELAAEAQVCVARYAWSLSPFSCKTDCVSTNENLRKLWNQAK
jgi:hypothetical protein